GYLGLGFTDQKQQNFSSEFWKYDTAQDKWTQVASFPNGARSFGSALVINNVAFAGLGYASGVTRADWWKFGSNPTIGFIGNQTSVCIGASVTFTDTSSFGPSKWA